LFKRIALAAVAAAGMMCAAQAQPAPVFNWSGFYVGGTVGYGDGNYRFRNDVNGIATRPFDMNGAVGGLTAGYNWQARGSAFVFGLETDVSLSGVKGSGDDPAFGCGTPDCHASVKWFGTVRPRAGVTFNNTLFFVTGGWAFGNVEAFNDDGGGNKAGSSKVQNGWTAGAGVEWAFSPRWSAKLEYLHVDLGGFVYKFSGASPISVRGLEFDVVRLGMNYRW
jgi:outer membrane immunogenic protein